MKKIFCIGFYLPDFRNVMFYCFDPQRGPYLSDDIRFARYFMSHESASSDAPHLMEYFFNDPVSYSIFDETKKF